MIKKENAYKIFTCLFVLLVAFNVGLNFVNGQAIFDYTQTPGRDTSNTVEKLDSSVSKVWGSVLLILQIVAVGVFVFAGVRYMFASADQKADIKKSIAFLMIGAAFTFGASTVIKFIVRAAADITGK